MQRINKMPKVRILSLYVWWYALMAIGGMGFGLLGDRRPFGHSP